MSVARKDWLWFNYCSDRQRSFFGASIWRNVSWL